MSYNPALPLDDTKATAAEMRAQFNGLKDISDALAENTVTAAVIDAVNTIAAGQPANATVNVTGNTLHLAFDIPRGADGTDGTDGSAGADGAQGIAGPQGPPFAGAIVDGVTTVNPGEPAAVNTSFDGANVRFTFDIPRGATGTDGPPGAQGAQGNDGAQGPTGVQGPTGEVSAQQLADGITDALATAAANSSANTNAVATLDTPFANDPPTLADIEVLRAKMNELILGMRR